MGKTKKNNTSSAAGSPKKKQVSAPAPAKVAKPRRPMGRIGEGRLTDKELLVYPIIRGVRMFTHKLKDAETGPNKGHVLYTEESRLHDCLEALREEAADLMEGLTDKLALETTSRPVDPKTGEPSRKVQSSMLDAVLAKHYGVRIYGYDDAFPDAVPRAFRSSSSSSKHGKEKKKVAAA
jgi:hypothetical protein